MKNIDYTIKERQTDPQPSYPKTYGKAPPADDEYNLDEMEDFKIDGLAEFSTRLKQPNAFQKTITPPTAAQPSSFDQFMAAYSTHSASSTAPKPTPFDNFEF